MVSISVRINNLSSVEDYLNAPDQLEYTELIKNKDVNGVLTLICQLADCICPHAIGQFYYRTGLKLQAQLNKVYDLTIFDRNGIYPRPDASIFDEDFVNGVSKHPEWLEPQEEPDLIMVIQEDDDMSSFDTDEEDYLPF